MSILCKDGYKNANVVPGAIKGDLTWVVNERSGKEEENQAGNGQSLEERKNATSRITQKNGGHVKSSND